jgi:hypothetical protein
MRRAGAFAGMAALALLLALPARAENRLTAGDLEQMCHSASDLDYGYCAGYVTAVADQLMEGSIAEFRACNHGAVKSQQYIDIYNAFIAQRPALRRGEAETAVAAAFARAFPCAPQKF